ncbi:cytochrome b/b6 domain-containing protein [Roseovarius sp. LXJ103]|uniref:cytochrome b/b6 domain-containing protein n=1 Tax=Roseovarius carneus TaxID=2853164 RepID=UPI000D6054F1|nr:cytochrome b/b6 domain-containing protein [Roseovarius carneus]MBZ8118794.1 cytochrome b/b6 domain-containing protein [Roseovarius carneus]PWE35534.1 cytochrome [Pelagicola sp. LXJ1103]
MPLTNTRQSYGAITKTFHWISALMILTLFALGIIGSNLADQIKAGTAGQDIIDWAVLLFSVHKTLGLTLFAVALARIGWAIAQPKPGLLNGDHVVEARLAVTVHWLLYGSLVAVPLSGWVHHAATTGFAPIWWPFGQTLPFVPRDPHVAEISGAVHYILQWVLAGSIALHAAGAIKHHVIDKDATLRRMLPGGGTAETTTAQPGHALPLVAALMVWGAAMGASAGLGWFSKEAPSQTALAEVQSDWTVQEGTLAIAITQGGAEVTGSFADWTAEITYDEMPDTNGTHGAVSVTVAIPSLTLGSVTGQAMAADFFNAEAHPTATFKADLITRDSSLIADGTLRIKETEIPVSMPVTLSIEGDIATASGALSVDRRDFGIGMSVGDEASLAFAVEITFALTAQR